MFSNVSCSACSVPVISFIYLSCFFFFLPLHPTLKLNQICNSLKWTFIIFCRYNLAVEQSNLDHALSWKKERKIHVQKYNAWHFYPILMFKNMVYVWVFHNFKVTKIMKIVTYIVTGKISKNMGLPLNFKIYIRIHNHLNMRAARDLDTY